MVRVETGVVRSSVLCVPADSARKIAKALASGADEVVLDLEDAVAVEAKSAARDVLVAALSDVPHHRPRLAVRVNGRGTPWCHRDLEAVVHLPVESVVLPKVESRSDLSFAEDLLDGLEVETGRAAALEVQALVETATGLTRLADIASRPRRLTALILGYADLAASLGRARNAAGPVWLAAQELVLWHGRSAGLDVIDGPYLGVEDDEPFRSAARHTAELGFDGKWAIHPGQVGALGEIFAPDPAEVDHARRVIDALGSRGAVQLDGRLVDEAMALAARRVLARVRDAS